MAENYVLLETIELTQTASSVTFDNLPSSGYTDLKIVMSGRSTGVSSGTATYQERANIRFNGVATSYSEVWLQGEGGTGVNASNSSYFGAGATKGFAGTTTPSDWTAKGFSNSDIYITNYRSTTANKIWSVDGVAENNSAFGSMVLVAGQWANTSAITSINLFPNANSWAAGSSFSLFGVAEKDTTPVTAPFARGGNIVANDGTYWYHAFLNSGTFTPLKTMTTCELLMVQGGAGGSNGGGIGSGGGGGALFYSSGNSVTINNAVSVTVGAGGAPGASANDGFNGTLSGFGETSVSVVNKALGGGETYIGGNSKKVISGTTTNYSGGAQYGSPHTATRSGGGGAGAGANGGAASSGTSGTGGNGLNTYSAWATATTTGADSGYYGGGGGGGYEASGSYSRIAGGLGGGGQGGAGTTAPNYDATSGTANTGGGGGGCGGRAGIVGGASGTGGSGIVIVRYPMV